MTDLIPGAVTIGDLYRELVGMRSDLARVLAHQEATDLVNRNAEQIHADHEARIRALETAGARLAGKLAVMAGGGSVAGGWVGYILGHFIH